MGQQRYSFEEQAFYRAYINSPLWRQRKTVRLNMAGNRCEWNIFDEHTGDTHRCKRKTYLCVHHNTYERLGNELASDLNVYCWFHHMLEHILWKKCTRCTAPCLQNEVSAAHWLNVTLNTMGINLDSGPINWRILPNKEILLDQIDPMCSDCEHYFSKH